MSNRTTEQGLWCLYVYGPDDVHAAPSKAAAERAARHLSEYYRERGPHDPEMSFEAKPWPHSKESHAATVKWFYVNTGTSPDD